MSVRLRVRDAGVDRVRTESELVWSDVVSRPPAPALAGPVRAYTGYEEHARARRSFAELPSGEVALILSFGQAISITEPETQATVVRRSFVAGMHSRYAVTDVPRHQYGLEIRVTPIAAYTLLGVPMNALANRAVALDEVMGKVADELVERLASLPTWAERFDDLDAVLQRLLGRGRPPAPSTVHAWRRLEETAGAIPIAALAVELGASRKHIAERFREEIGISPKTLARVLRFRSAFRLLRQGQLTPSEVARACGYFDQAHFNRDVRELAGTTPVALTAR